MLIVTRSVEVAAPLDDTVRHWSGHERTSRPLSGSLASFQRITDESTRIILTTGPHVLETVDVVEMLLDNDLRQFKRTIETRQSFLAGLANRLRALVP